MFLCVTCGQLWEVSYSFLASQVCLSSARLTYATEVDLRILAALGEPAAPNINGQPETQEIIQQAHLAWALSLLMASRLYSEVVV